MTRMYLLGGEDIVKRDSKKIDNRALIDAGGSPAVLVFPWTGKPADGRNKYSRLTAEYFADLGARSVEFVRLSDSLQEIGEKVNASDLVYLPGGDARLLLARMRNSKADSLVRGYDGVTVGNSAGALVLSRNYVVVKEQFGEPIIEVALGLVLVDFGISVHYRSSNTPYPVLSFDEKLKDLSVRLRKEIYAIPERCALICSSGRLSFLGDVYLFREGQRMKCEAGWRMTELKKFVAQHLLKFSWCPLRTSDSGNLYRNV